MKENSIAKALSSKSRKAARGGSILPPPVTLTLSYPGPGRGRGWGRGGKFGPINDQDSGTADA